MAILGNAGKSMLLGGAGKIAIPHNLWDILPEGPPPISVVEGVRGTKLCEVQPKATWTLENLVHAVSRATSIAGEEFRLVWKGSPIAPGKLPDALLALGDVPFTIILVRVDPCWVDALDEVLAGLCPEPPSLEDLCEGRLGIVGKGPLLSNDNREVALAAVQHNGSMLSLCTEELLHDKDIVLAAVRECGLALRFVPEAIRKDREVVLTAVESDGDSLRLAKEFQADREIVTAAILQEGEAVRHASYELKEDRSFLLAAIRSSAKAFLHVPPLLQNEKPFVISAVRANGDVLTYVPREVRTNKEVMLAAKAHWAGEGDVPPKGEGFVRMAHLWKPSTVRTADSVRAALHRESF